MLCSENLESAASQLGVICGQMIFEYGVVTVTQIRNDDTVCPVLNPPQNTIAYFDESIKCIVEMTMCMLMGQQLNGNTAKPFIYILVQWRDPCFGAEPLPRV